MQNPELIKVKEQIAHLQRRINSISREKEAAKAKAKDHAARVQELKDQLSQLHNGELSLVVDSF